MDVNEIRFFYDWQEMWLTVFIYSSPTLLSCCRLYALWSIVEFCFFYTCMGGQVSVVNLITIVAYISKEEVKCQLPQLHLNRS